MQKQIKIKNYFILLVIVLVTCIIFLYLFSWLKQYNEVKVGIPIISNTLQEVKYDNLSSLVTERDFVIIYTCTTSEKACRSFENKFIDYIKKENLNDTIIYLNIGYNSDEKNVLSKLYKNYKHNDLIKRLNTYPSIIIFSNSKIVDFISSDEGVNNKLTIAMVEQFLKGYGVIND